MRGRRGERFLHGNPTGKAESDGFNKLIISLPCTWREAALIRALARYRQQSGLDPTQAVQEQALANNSRIAELTREQDEL